MEKAERNNRICGGELFIVGGAVRDEALGKEASDIDFLVTGVEVADMPFDKGSWLGLPRFFGGSRRRNLRSCPCKNREKKRAKDITGFPSTLLPKQQWKKI